VELSLVKRCPGNGFLGERCRLCEVASPDVVEDTVKGDVVQIAFLATGEALASKCLKLNLCFALPAGERQKHRVVHAWLINHHNGTVAGVEFESTLQRRRIDTASEVAPQQIAHAQRLA
jgi:hypothetical protein